MYALDLCVVLSHQTERDTIEAHRAEEARVRRQAQLGEKLTTDARELTQVHDFCLHSFS